MDKSIQEQLIENLKFLDKVVEIESKDDEVEKRFIKEIKYRYDKLKVPNYELINDLYHSTKIRYACMGLLKIIKKEGYPYKSLLNWEDLLKIENIKQCIYYIVGIAMCAHLYNCQFIMDCEDIKFTVISWSYKERKVEKFSSETPISVYKNPSSQFPNDFLIEVSFSSYHIIITVP